MDAPDYLHCPLDARNCLYLERSNQPSPERMVCGAERLQASSPHAAHDYRCFLSFLPARLSQS
jgi:hypothetical protein